MIGSLIGSDPGVGGGELPYDKVRGACGENFEFNPCSQETNLGVA